MITVTTPQLAAAFRLATKLPKRVHLAPEPPPPPAPVPRSKEHTAARRLQIRLWLKQGMSRDEMAAKLKITEAAVRLHIKAIKAAR